MWLRFKSNCVNTPRSDCDALNDMIADELTISRITFRKHAHPGDLARLEKALGYETHHARGLTMAADWHVSYHRSKWKGKRCYYFKHSGIEYYFTECGAGLVEDSPVLSAPWS